MTKTTSPMLITFEGAGAIKSLLDVEKNPDVRELLRLHFEVALRECGHPNAKLTDYDGSHTVPVKWCPDCRIWV